jgi:endonuclease YncB( thermonuclease family)
MPSRLDARAAGRGDLRSLLIVISLLLPLWALFESAVRGESNSMTARVTRISDGDTLTVVDRRGHEYRVRLLGIDAPELGQPYSQVARSHLARLIGNQAVRITWEKKDRYDRLLAFVSRDGTNFNLALVSAGLAWFYRAYEKDLPLAERQRLDRAEAEARSSRRGLWQEPSPVPPWDYRAAQRGGSSARRQTPPPRGPDPVESDVTLVRGNRNSGIYHLPNCPDYDRISARNQVPFRSEREALQHGFRKARNCP